MGCAFCEGATRRSFFSFDFIVLPAFYHRGVEIFDLCVTRNLNRLSLLEMVFVDGNVLASSPMTCLRPRPMQFVCHDPVHLCWSRGRCPLPQNEDDARH